MNEFISKYQSKILIGGGLVLMGTGTCYLMMKAPVVHDIRRQAPKEQKKLETAKQILKEIWPGALAWVVGAGAIAAADAVSTQKLVAATATAEVAKDIYRIRVDAEQKALAERPEGRDILSSIQKEVGEKIATEPKTRALASAATPSCSVVQTGDGDQLFVLRPIQMKFRSSMDAITRANNAIKDDIRRSGYASLNDYLRELNLPTSSMFERVGWNNDHPFDISPEPYIDGFTIVVDITFPHENEPVENYAHW